MGQHASQPVEAVRLIRRQALLFLASQEVPGREMQDVAENATGELVLRHDGGERREGESVTYALGQIFRRPNAATEDLGAPENTHDSVDLSRVGTGHPKPPRAHLQRPGRDRWKREKRTFLSWREPDICTLGRHPLGIIRDA
jgi:hypothetical protein